MAENERQPLLDSDVLRYDAVPGDIPAPVVDVPTRKTLTWSSAYILVISRVVGSGIFATPGSILRSAGSVGLALVLWVVGTILSGCGLAVSMEYGCMLPRSGGDKVAQSLGHLGLFESLIIATGLPGVYVSEASFPRVHTHSRASSFTRIHSQQLHCF